MSRYCGNQQSPAILSAAEVWKDQCLVNGGSIFNFGSIWTPENVDELVNYYVNNLDTGEGNFSEKLEKQLAPTSRGAKILCAEMMWVMMLCPSNIKPKKKRENIEMILDWAGEPLPNNDKILSDEVLSGIGSAGTAYNNLRWKELVYFVSLLQDFFRLDKSERLKLTQDGDKFATWCQHIEENDARQLRHMLVFLLFPDDFERIFGNSDRFKILASFSQITKKAFFEMPAFEVDLKLRDIRQRFETEYESNEIDWYVAPIRALWQNTTKSQESTEGESIYETLITFLDQAQTEDLRTKDYPGTHAGLIMRVSFGAGNQAHVPWIGLLGTGQTPTKGIYPVFLYYRSDQILILAKGVSATNKSLLEWDTRNVQTIEEYFNSEFGKSAIRYGESYIHSVYKLSEDLDKDQVDEDLSELIQDYKEIVGDHQEEIREPLAERYEAQEIKTDQEPDADISIEEAMKGIFLGKQRIDEILGLLRTKKNIVLQGPPWCR